jgi:hypothetical protein
MVYGQVKRHVHGCPFKSDEERENSSRELTPIRALAAISCRGLVGECRMQSFTDSRKEYTNLLQVDPTKRRN